MKTQLFVTALALAASTSAFGDDKVEITNVAVSGSGCADGTTTTGTTNSYPGWPNDYARAVFDDFKLKIPAGETGRVVKTCRTIIDVKIPAGYTIADISFDNSAFIQTADANTKVRIVTKLLAGEVNYIEPVQRNRYVVKDMAHSDFTFYKNYKFKSVGDIYDGACDQERTVQLEFVSRVVLVQPYPSAKDAIANLKSISLLHQNPEVALANLTKCQEPSDWSWGDDWSWGRDDDNSEDEVLGNIKPAY